MTNSQIERHIARGQRGARVYALFVAPIGGAFRARHESYLWRYWRLQWFVGEAGTSRAMRKIIDAVIEVYDLPCGAELLSLPQSVKLVETYRQFQLTLRHLETRLAELKELRATLTQKLGQLRDLGERHQTGLAQLNAAEENYVTLTIHQQQAHASCSRLEEIVANVQRAAHSRQLHRELDQLHAPATPTSEPIFESESLDGIGGQIGREIEIYLRLERETEERLR